MPILPGMTYKLEKNYIAELLLHRKTRPQRIWPWRAAGLTFKKARELWEIDSTPKVVLVIQSCPTLCNPMGYGPPGSFVHGILQARYWNGLPFPSPEDLSDLGIESGSSSLQADFLPSELPGRSVLQGCAQYLIPSGTQGRSNNPTGAWVRPTCWSQSISRRGRRKRSSL